MAFSVYILSLMRTVRLYTENDLAEGLSLTLSSAQAHYLSNVLRLKEGAPVILFNGRDGEWQSKIVSLRRNQAAVTLEHLIRPQETDPDLWLLFAPVKRARIDFIAAKATELGVSAIAPVFTDNTAVSRVNEERLYANAIEAAEQCGRLSVPVVQPVATLIERIESWPASRHIILCDETGGGTPVVEALSGLPRNLPWAILCGPEGGFSSQELDLLAKNPTITRVGLGPRILRADTAVLAALACWQAVLGDWRG
jgi:16S rRNA (uracil1498-N3)-methyltransferase